MSGDICALLHSFALFSASDRAQNDRVWELQEFFSLDFGPEGPCGSLTQRSELLPRTCDTLNQIWEI